MMIHELNFNKLKYLFFEFNVMEDKLSYAD